MLTFRNLFDAHDRTHSGFISESQFRDILKALGLPLDVDSVRIIWDQVHLNDEGKLSYSEFSKFVDPLTARFSEMLHEFRVHDEDKDGIITVHQVRTVMEQFEMRLSLNEVAHIMDRDCIDELEDQIDYKQFLKGATTFYKKRFLRIMLLTLDENDTVKGHVDEVESDSNRSYSTTHSPVIVVTEYGNEQDSQDEDDTLIERQVSVETAESTEMIQKSCSYMVHLENEHEVEMETENKSRNPKGIKVRQMSEEEIEETKVCCGCCWWRRKKNKVKPSNKKRTKSQKRKNKRKMKKPDGRR